MRRINKCQIESIVVLFFQLLLILLSFCVNDRTVSWVDNDGELHFSDEYMSGGEDFVALFVAVILFLPVSILYFINIFRLIKVRLLILIITILMQLFCIHIWFDSSDIFLNLLYGAIAIRIWIITFGIIIVYAISKIIVIIINIIKKHNINHLFNVIF